VGSIEVFFKEGKQRLGLGQEQGHSFAAQVFSVVQTFCRYRLLAYLLEHDEQSQTIGEIFRQLEEETGKITFLERLRQNLSALLKKIFDPLAHFYDPFLLRIGVKSLLHNLQEAPMPKVRHVQVAIDG